MLAILLPVVLIAVVVGGGAFYFRDKPGGIRSLFTPSRLDVDRELTSVLGARFDPNYQPADGVGLFEERWWTGKHLVRTMPNQVVAYDLTTGKVAWQVDVPPNHYCMASGQQSANGYVALLGGNREDGCRKLTVVDIGNGKVVWTKDLPPANPERGSKELLATEFPRFDHRPVVHGERVYVPTDQGGHILNVKDGSVVQRPNPKSTCFTTHYDAIGDVGLAYRNCARYGDKGRHLSGFDQAGKVIWRWNLPEERGRTYRLVGVLSADPLLVRVFGEHGRKEVWRVEPGGPDGGGKHTVVADLSYERAESQATDPCEPAGGDGLYDCSQQVVAAGVLYLPHRKRHQSNDARNGMAAYDIKTGKRLWWAEWDAWHDITAPLGIDDAGHPLAYLLPTEDDPAALVRVDPKTGAMTPVAKLSPENQASSSLGRRGLTEAPEAGNVEWHKGYLAFFQTQARERDAGYGATVVYK